MGNPELKLSEDFSQNARLSIEMILICIAPAAIHAIPFRPASHKLCRQAELFHRIHETKHSTRAVCTSTLRSHIQRVYKVQILQISSVLSLFRVRVRVLVNKYQNFGERSWKMLALSWIARRLPIRVRKCSRV